MELATSFTSWDESLRKPDPNSLQHYGVLGMKWGMRKYQNKDGSLTGAGQKHYAKTGEYGYHYHSHATKKYQKKAAKAEAKGKTAKAAIYANRAKKSAELDKREEAVARKTSTGKAVLARMLVNPDVIKAYHQLNAMSGGSKKIGLATKGKNALLSAYGGTLISRMSKAAYLREGEKANKNKGFSNRYMGNYRATDQALSKVDDVIRKKRKKYGI